MLSLDYREKRRLGLWTPDDKPLFGSELIEDRLLRGPVGCWLFNEGAGKRVFDLSGKGNHLTLANGAFWDDRGLEFDGVNDYAFRTDGDLSNDFPGKSGGSANSFSVLIRVRPDLLRNYDMFLSKQDDGDRSWALFTSNSANVYFQMGTGATTYVNAYTAGGVLSAGKWHHIAAVFDDPGNKMTIYIDGSVSSNGSNNPKTHTGSLRASTKDFRVAQYGAGNDSLDAAVMLVNVYNRPLSDEEIFWDYINPHGNYRPSERSFHALAGGVGPMMMHSMRGR